MSSPTLVDLFVEDRAHQELLTPLVYRVAFEEGRHIAIRLRSARGGHGKALDELALYQQAVTLGKSDEELPQALVVGVDGNCSTFTKKSEEIRRAATERFAHRLVVACPDPHVERWYLADPQSFEQVVGYRPKVRGGKCEKDYYKRLLVESVRKGGQVPTLGGVEFARELAQKMDLYRAGRVDHSLRAFLEDLRSRLRQVRGGEGGPG